MQTLLMLLADLFQLIAEFFEFGFSYVIAHGFDTHVLVEELAILGRAKASRAQSVARLMKMSARSLLKVI